jgi:hypothetical protein
MGVFVTVIASAFVGATEPILQATAHNSVTPRPLRFRPRYPPHAPISPSATTIFR